MKSKFVIIACALVIFSLISAGYNPPRTVTITPRETAAAPVLTDGTADVDSSAETTVSVSAAASERTEMNTGTLYILNTNTKRFHIPHCKSVQQMKDKNKSQYVGTRDTLIAEGYIPCGNCNP